MLCTAKISRSPTLCSAAMGTNSLRCVWNLLLWLHSSHSDWIQAAKQPFNLSDYRKVYEKMTLLLTELIHLCVSVSILGVSF